MLKLNTQVSIVSSLLDSMRAVRCAILMVCFSLFMPSGFAADADPLFQTHKILELTLKGPLKTISRKRELDVRYPAVLTYRDEENETIELKVELEARGNFRRRRSTCKFTPLKLIFNKNHTEGTVFENQKKLKLVNQCDPVNRKYEEYLMLEYLAYRVFNEITPLSFSVRLANITYEEVDSKRKPRRNLAFFIEHKKRLAKRIGAKQLKIQKSSAVDIDSRHLNQGSLFQLLIANVDWSATHGKQEECCHNYKLFRLADERLLSIPYDFDLAGIVNAKYSKPFVGMGQTSIRKRLYRGYCRNNYLLDENIEMFNNKKAAILALYQEFPYLSDRKKKAAIAFINGFYKIINNEKRVKRVVMNWCHKSTMRIIE
ncbi:MAG: hypothetical protein ACI8W1_001580 [Candidatus Azotimanducaceae bacterium]|jgi:hypothetical protein